MAAELFRKVDQDGSGDVAEEESIKYAKNSEMTALASSLELDVMAQFCKMLSYRGKYPVDVHTFTVGFIELKGSREYGSTSTDCFQQRAARTPEDLLVTSECTAALVQQILPIIHSATKSSQCTNRFESAALCPLPTPGDAEVHDSLSHFFLFMQ